MFLFHRVLKISIALYANFKNIINEVSMVSINLRTELIEQRLTVRLFFIKILSFKIFNHNEAYKRVEIFVKTHLMKSLRNEVFARLNLLVRLYLM